MVAQIVVTSIIQLIAVLPNNGIKTEIQTINQIAFWGKEYRLSFANLYLITLSFARA